MQIDDILKECVDRKKADPTKQPDQIVNALMDELAAYRAALIVRPEFSTTPNDQKADVPLPIS